MYFFLCGKKERIQIALCICRVNTDVIICVHSVIGWLLRLVYPKCEQLSSCFAVLGAPEVSINMRFTHMEQVLYPSKYKISLFILII